MYELSIVDPDTEEDVSGPFEDGQQVKLVYECPFCEHEETDTLTMPIAEFEQGACAQCSRNYLITAKTLPQRLDDTFYNRVAYQLRGLKDIEGFRRSYPDDVPYLSVAPENIVFAIVITGFAVAGIIGLSLAFPSRVQTDFRFAVGFIFLLLAVSLGVTTALATSVGAIYRVVLYMEAYDVDASIRDFILYAANLRGNDDPYLIRSDIF